MDCHVVALLAGMGRVATRQGTSQQIDDFQMPGVPMRTPWG